MGTSRVLAKLPLAPATLLNLFAKLSTILNCYNEEKIVESLRLLAYCYVWLPEINDNYSIFY